MGAELLAKVFGVRDAMTTKAFRVLTLFDDTGFPKTQMYLNLRNGKSQSESSGE